MRWHVSASGATLSRSISVMTEKAAPTWRLRERRQARSRALQAGASWRRPKTGPKSSKVAKARSSWLA